MEKAGLYTTDGHEIPLRGVEVTGDVMGAHALVRVRQRYQNAEKKPVEAIYTFPLPSDATLVGFAMIADGRRIEGSVKEREAAFRVYDDAILDGHGAALLEQERPNVFTANVGNLLPGEETLVEIKYVQRVQADEGAIRWMIPTLVAPRYIPGTPQGDRTAHGTAQPTSQVPDADRITPAIGDVSYGLKLEVVFDLGSELTVESPSHKLLVAREDGKKVRVSFQSGEVALDRDVIITARSTGAGALQLSTVAAHKDKADPDPGVLALTVIPDLAGLAGGKPARQEVVFLIDVSGSMQGASITEATAALRLCLRHLREGDRFNVIAFQSRFTSFSDKGPVPFTQRSLTEVDAWVNALRADGGTELLPPMVAAAQQAKDGVIVLLTDGQVGNEDEILKQVLATRGQARIYSFGIGTNVSDVLLRGLAKQTGGAVEFIHPGERIDEKVVAQFARAVAPRVTDVTISFADLDVGELAPGELPALVDGEPWAIFARVTGTGSGRAEIRGKLAGEAFYLAVPIDFSDPPNRPMLAKLWASERIRDLERAELLGRRAERMKERIVELAVKHGIASTHTSFVVVEQRTGARRANGQPETRAIPVNLPAGWAMFEPKPQAQQPGGRAHGFGSVNRPMMPGMGMPPPAPSSPAPMAAAPMKTMMYAGASAADDVSFGAGPAGGAESEKGLLSKIGGLFGKKEKKAVAYSAVAPAKADKESGGDHAQALLERQLASGLWDEPGQNAGDLRATSRALVELLAAGITTVHALHGAQIKKAVEALLKLAATVAAADPQAAELALGICWLIASGRRTRGEIEAVVKGTPALKSFEARLQDERALRTHVESLAG